MRLNKLAPEKDKNLQRNLRTLLLCSSVRTIIMTAKQKQLENEQKRLLKSPKSAEYLEYLKETAQEYITKRGGNPDEYDLDSPEDFCDFVIPEEQRQYIPGEVALIFEQHQENAKKIKLFDRQLDEQTELRDILHGHQPINSVAKRINLRELNHYLDKKNHSKDFKNFANDMRTKSAFSNILKYKGAALFLAHDKGIADKTFMEKLTQTFTIKDLNLGLNKQFKAILRPALVKLTTLVAAGVLSFNGLFGMMKDTDKNVSIADMDTHSAYVQDVSQEQSFNDSTYIAMDTKNAIEPISKTEDFDTYNGAVKDLMKKTQEIYTYNTGRNVDLSNLEYGNIGYADTTIYTATLNGKTIRVSSMSNHTTNKENLEKALKATGAKVTSEKSSIAYLTNKEDKTIAIADENGAIKSGNIMTKAYSGHGEMYNQSYISSAKQMLEKKGINTNGMSEEKLIGQYLFENNDQNTEVSNALGTVLPLVRQIKGTFYGKDDKYTVYSYKQKAEAIRADFNKQAQENQQNNTQKDSQTKDSGDER